MDCQLICTWLSLQANQWPPDHYTLLDLEPGEADRERIEQHAHERLLCLRRYQLTNPELATEAMNRLAQAVVCLIDPDAKKAYDATLAGEQPVTDVSVPGYAAAEESGASAAAGPIDPLAWLFGPWNPGKAEPAASAPAPATIDWSTSPPPPRLPATPPADPIPADTIIGANGTAVDAPAAPTEGVPVPPVAAPPPPVDPAVEAARSSAPARRGLLTKRALYTRIARTRRLLRAWEEAGKYLRNRERRLARRAEATDLVHQLSTVRQLLRNFPPLLGEAGQPGYSVIALARQQLIIQTFQGLLPSQREVLARDWKDGHTLLAAHRQFLREELRALRRKGIFGRTARAVRAFLAAHPGFWLLMIGTVTLNLVVLPVLRKVEDARWQVLFLFAQLVVLLGVLGVGVAHWRKNFRRSWLDRPRSEKRKRVVSPAGSALKPTTSPQMRSFR